MSAGQDGGTTTGELPGVRAICLHAPSSRGPALGRTAVTSPPGLAREGVCHVCGFNGAEGCKQTAAGGLHSGGVDGNSSVGPYSGGTLLLLSMTAVQFTDNTFCLTISFCLVILKACALGVYVFKQHLPQTLSTSL